MNPSLSESLGNRGQKGISSDDSTTDSIASAVEVKGRLPMPVTAPAGTNGRLREDRMGVDCTLSVLCGGSYPEYPVISLRAPRLLVIGTFGKISRKGLTLGISV